MKQGAFSSRPKVGLVTETPLRVLLIEDDKSMRETLAELLDDRGYQVETVASGDGAVELAQRSHFDIVVTDIRTEGRFDGLSALEQVRERQPDVSGVVITGYSTEDYALRAVKLRVEDYLKKPFQLADFLDRIDRIAVEKRRALGEQKERSSLRQTLIWFGQQVAASGEEPGGLDSGLFLSQVGNLGDKMGLGASLKEELGIAARMVLCEELLGLEWPDCVQFTVPSATWTMLCHRHEAWDGSGEPEGLREEEIPVGSRVLAFALAAASHPEKSGEQLLQLQQGRYDPSLVTLHDQGGAAPAELGGMADSLMALGLALEEAGQAEQALQTFETLAADYPNSRSTVFALLGQARIHRARGELKKAAAAGRLSFERSQRQGPDLAGLCALQAGVLLSQQKEPDGKALLEQAARRLEQSREVAERALCALARAHFWEVEGPTDAAIKILQSPEYTASLVSNGNWLVPYLLQSEPSGKPLLTRCARECPGAVMEAVLDRALPEFGRCTALKLLVVHSGGRSLSSLLKLLENDESAEIQKLARAALSHSGKETALPTLRLYGFGGLRVLRGEERLDKGWRGQKLKFFLAYLLSLEGRSVSDESLLDVFWPGPVDKGKMSLRAALSYLRRQLVPKDAPGEINYFLKKTGTVQLNPELPVWYDLTEAQLAHKQMRHLLASDQLEKAVTPARQLSRLYQGPFLHNCYMDWAVRLREQTDQAATEALSLLSGWSLKSGRYEEAIELSKRALGIDPCLEISHGDLMRAYLETGRPQEALRQFERCAHLLEEELAVEPSPALQNLREQAAKG